MQHPAASPHRRFSAVLWSSAISAAFIGPGTVTTCARAGAGYGLELLWALTFSTLACIVLQEASARLTIVSGHSLGAALRLRYPTGWPAIVVVALVLGAIVLGCAAYQTGNILGAIAGVALVVAAPGWLLTLLVAAAAGTLLWFGSTRLVAIVLGALVAVMGVAFLLCAFLLRPDLGALVSGLVVPALPAGSGLLVLGLVGTTVVPYNLFLGSGIARGQTVPEARFGLVLSIGFGGLISMTIVIAGTAVSEPFGFEGLGRVLAERLGSWAEALFALGLFAAGFSSAITAPLAAAMTARGMLAQDAEDPRWQEDGLRYRGVWLGVLAFGTAFGLAGVRPIPAILLAQALNGVLLPVVAIFLLIAVNERRVMGEEATNGTLANLAGGLVVAVTVVLGGWGLWRTLAAVFG